MNWKHGKEDGQWIFMHLNIMPCEFQIKNPIITLCILKGHMLKVNATSKYMGVDLIFNLDWVSHIDKVAKKSNSILGFLRRNLRIKNEKN